MEVIVQLLSMVMLSLLAAASAQRSPYAAGVSDPGVLPQYQNKGSDIGDRFGGDVATKSPDRQMYKGTLQTEDLYNRVASWPSSHLPFWYLNAAALQREREQQQPQQKQQQLPSRPQQRMRRPFSTTSRFSSCRP